MSQVMRYTFHLFGPRAGKNMKINGHQFTKGVYEAVVGVEAAASLMKVMGYYGAYAFGTPEYEEAMKKQIAEVDSGGSEVDSGPERGEPDSVSGEFQLNGSESTNEVADVGTGATNSETRGSGSSANGDGHEYAGIPKFEEAASIPQPSEPASGVNEDIKRAILKLDPENEEHWVQTGAHKGKPKLSAVEEAYGKANLTRQDLESALPNWSQESARVSKQVEASV